MRFVSLFNKPRYNKVLKSPMLTRDFISDRLYHSTSGYFCKKDLQIGELKNPINFKNLIGYEEYQRKLSENYPENAWLTPSEIFKPYYGMSIGNYIHQYAEFLNSQGKLKNNQIKIIEVGAGLCTAAQSILMFFKNFEQKYYQNIEYNIVEISPQLCKKAADKLSIDNKKLLDRGQIKIYNDDFVNFKPPSQNDHYFIIFLEVLDNMPHDRIYYDNSIQDWNFQTQLSFTDEFANENIKEEQVPIKDPLIKEMLQIYKSLPEMDEIEYNKYEKGFVQKMIKWYYQQEQKNIFLPTFCYKILKHINKNFKNHHLIIADFDLLRTAISAKYGINAPVVSTKLKEPHAKHDYTSYLVERGQADIFFQTDFRLLQSMYKKSCGKSSVVYKTHEFMQNFSREQWTETKSGYNPLKEDFANTSFLVSSPEK